MKLGVRSSKLALAYADKVVRTLQPPSTSSFPIIKIKTEGDVKHNVPIQEMGGKGVFVQKQKNNY